ncbi:MAG: transcription-repair coupling factor, partial [Sphingomonadaceae bacterium]|nr:transcription-repair coupling factor [Sphingomonadaceae bacterium]
CDAAARGSGGGLSGAAQLVVTTVAAITQRTLTPFRVRALTAELKPGARIDRDRLAALLQANGYVRTDTVADAGEFAVRGGLVDLFLSGSDEALRLDFFGDEIESIRRFDPADQRTIGRAESFTLLPASEALLDEESISRFRGRYRELFGATATGDPLYQAVSEGRRLAGMEHWLPLLEDGLATLFDHLGKHDVFVRDAGTTAAGEARFEAIADYHANRVQAQRTEPGSYRPLDPEALYLSEDEWQARIAETPLHLTTPFHEPPSERVIEFGVAPARDFAPERKAGSNVYDAVVAHIEALRREGKRVVLASYSRGARERLRGLLAEHGLAGTVEAETWQEALGLASPLPAREGSGEGYSRLTAAPDGERPTPDPSLAGRRVSLIILPLDHGFTTREIAVLTEQDMLGDRLRRRTRRRKSADAFINELATLTPGDLVVHADHGIGRYGGLTQIPVQNAPHDCVALEYAGRDKLYVPVENLDVLSRYGAESEGVALDRLGGEAWQRRKSRMKERIRAIAGELIATAAARA